MAEDAHYASESATNKRKYEDNTSFPPSSGRRQTGFSAPIASQLPSNASAPGSYNNVPPPMDEIQIAKQKAQAIAARLLGNAAADPTKRPRFGNGDSHVYSSENAISVVSPQMGGSYGYPGASKRIEIPNGKVGVIIGKAGDTIKNLQAQSGAKIQVTRDTDADPNSPTRGVDLSGTSEQIAKAEQLIKDVLAEAESGGSGMNSRRTGGQQYGGGGEQYITKIPNNKVGLIIGKGGETIKSMQASSGARIQVIPLHLPPGDQSTERTLQIDGTSEEIEAANQLVNEVLSENRLRNPSMGGGGGYHQAPRPPTSWAPQGGGDAQSGYGGGYMPPAPYPPQYNTSQPPYSSSGYPQQSGWDQTAQGGGGYDYYNQQHQQAPGAPTDGSGAAAYGYGQPGYGQGYGGQDGYGGYPQSGYGYDQQGYNSNSGSGYGVGNASSNTTPPPDGQTAPAASYGAQGDSNTTNTQPPPQVVQSSGYPTGQQQPSPNPNPNPSYPPPTQSAYAMPPTSQAPPPPTNQPPYGQSPNTQGYAQSGYGYPAAQPGYGYGPPGSYPGYGQQQAPPPAGGYNAASYGGGYSQPAATAYDAAAAPPSQSSSQPAAKAKASPQS